jgi:hypothetical protein
MADSKFRPSGNSAAPRTGEPHSGARTPSMHDLEGELGERAKLAWDAAIDIEQCADAVVLLRDRSHVDSDRVVWLILRHIKALSGVIMSCTTDDDTIENLRERAGYSVEAS